jgi:hypothetical protein
VMGEDFFFIAVAVCFSYTAASSWKRPLLYRERSIIIQSQQWQMQCHPCCCCKEGKDLL